MDSENIREVIKSRENGLRTASIVDEVVDSPSKSREIIRDYVERTLENLESQGKIKKNGEHWTVSDGPDNVTTGTMNSTSTDSIISPQCRSFAFDDLSELSSGNRVLITSTPYQPADWEGHWVTSVNSQQDQDTTVVLDEQYYLTSGSNTSQFTRTNISTGEETAVNSAVAISRISPGQELHQWKVFLESTGPSGRRQVVYPEAPNTTVAEEAALEMNGNRNMYAPIVSKV